jgi:hypothetical protein
LIFIENSDNTKSVISFHAGSVLTFTNLNVEILVRLPNIVILNLNLEGSLSLLSAHID